MPDSVEQPIALYDPGEVGRSEHIRGDRVVVGISNVVAWLFPILMVAICAQVVLRGMGHNQAWLDDLQWWLYGVAVLVGVAYAVTTNSHVRVDIFYDNFPERKKTRIDIFGLVWLFLPFIILCWDLTIHYAVSSVQAWEGSDSPNGLHNLWILKVSMNAIFAVVILATWSAYRRLLSRLIYPTLFRQLIGALPSVFFLINLAVYYSIWWVLKLTQSDPETGEPLTNREVGRLPIFNEFDFGQQEIRYTIVITLGVTLLVLAWSWMRSRRREG